MLKISKIFDFTTLKYYTHGRKGSLDDNRYGKCVIDINNKKIKNFHVKNPHSLIKECGSQGSAFPNYYVSLLRVNHYSLSKQA